MIILVAGRGIYYLDEWSKSVEQRKGFSKLEKKHMLLSTETLLGIRITGTCVVIFSLPNLYLCLAINIMVVYFAFSEVVCGADSIHLHDSWCQSVLK